MTLFYIKIYKIFIKKQNEEIEHFFDIKIKEKIFDDNCKNKINIQQIRKEVFTFKKFHLLMYYLILLMEK